jgi:hypothetical protein
VVGCTGVDDPVRRWWSQRHGVVCGGERGWVPASSEWGPGCRGRGPRRRELGWGRGRRGHVVRRHVVGRRRRCAVGGRSQESRRRRTGGTGGLTRPHGDGVGPGVVERRPALAATPAGGTSTGGAAIPTSALARATDAVDSGSRTRGRGRGPSRAPNRLSARGLSPGRRLSTRGGAVDCRGRRGSLDRHGELLKEKLIPHDMEGGKRHDPLDESLQMAVARAEATQEVQHQGTVRHRLAEITEGVRQALHLAAVLPTERSLWENWWNWASVEVKGPSIPVPEKLFLESEPRLAALVRLVADDVLELDGDGAVEPGEHHGVHQGPSRGWRSDDVVEDVVDESIVSQGEEDLPPPARVVGGRRVQHDGHEGPDVVETGSLCVEGSDVVGVESRGEGGLGSGRWCLPGTGR